MDNYIQFLIFATGFAVGGCFFSLLWGWIDIRRKNKEKQQVPPAPYNGHHVLCNYWMRPREGCTLCDRLYELHPDE